MILQSLLVTALTIATALALPNPKFPSPRSPSYVQERVIHSRDISYQIEKRVFEPAPHVEEHAPKPKTNPRLEGSLGGQGVALTPESKEQGVALTPESTEQIRSGKKVPQYAYGQPESVLTEEPKAGDGKSGVYSTKKALQVWMNGVKIRIMRRSKALLSKLSGGLYNPGFDLSALSKKDAAKFRSLARNKPREINGQLPFEYIDTTTGDTLFSWYEAGSHQTYARGDFRVEVDGTITTKGQFFGLKLDKNGVFESGELKGWTLNSDGSVAEGPYQGNRLNFFGDIVDGPLKGWTLKPDGTIVGPLFKGSKISHLGMMETGPATGFKIQSDGTVLNGRFEGLVINTKGIFTTGAVKGFRLSPDGTILSPENFKGLRLDPEGRFDESGGAYAALHGLKVNSDGTLPAKALRGIQLVRVENTIAFTGVLNGFKLAYPGTDNKYLDQGDHYFTMEGVLKGWLLRSDGKVWKINTNEPWFMPLDEPDDWKNKPATAKFDTIRDGFDLSSSSPKEKEWNAGIEQIAADLKKFPPGTAKLKRSNTILAKIGESPDTISGQSDSTNAQQQIEEYIAFYTACQANVTTLIEPTLMSLLASPPAAQLPLLSLAAASIYADLARSNILISGPFWQGMYDFSNFTVEAIAANVSQTELIAMNTTNSRVAGRYVAAWANTTRLLNATTLEADMDRVASYLNPNDISLLPQDWTDQTAWDPNMNAYFPNTTTS